MGDYIVGMPSQRVPSATSVRDAADWCVSWLSDALGDGGLVLTVVGPEGTRFNVVTTRGPAAEWSVVEVPAVATAAPFACAECGTTTAQTYVVTTLDPADPEHTRTEVCRVCDDKLRADDPAGSRPCMFTASLVSAHHSEDRVEVWHGHPKPAILCGYHASEEWRPDALAYVSNMRKAAAHNPDLATLLSNVWEEQP